MRAALAEDAHAPAPDRGKAIALRGVTARAGGHDVLRDVTLAIAPGSHVAIVGASGAGKSSLIALLLGLLEVGEGSIAVDGAPLDPPAIARLRRETAWVDPTVTLWKRTLVENVVFGNDGAAASRAADAIDAADLARVLEGLPDGMQTAIGEGGARLSGGQGQRVRLARALLRDRVRLVLLDEAFRGLERDRRRALLRRARSAWRDATMLVVSHDVSDVIDLDRVLVVSDGRVVEDGVPSVLARTPGSRFRALAAGDAELRAALFGGDWRRVRVEAGGVTDGEPALEVAS
jgi:ATP-binding cassette subfamily B protein